MEPETRESTPTPASSPPPADPPTPATGQPQEESNGASAKKKRRKKRLTLPKGMDMKKYYAKKPGKERAMYVKNVKWYQKKKKERQQQQPQTETVEQPVARRPWVKPDMEEATQTLAAEARELEPAKRSGAWPKGFDPMIYAKMGSEERFEYVNKLRKKQGLAPKPRNKIVVPDKFKLPEGIDVEKFLSLNPGRQRMEYLARYIRQHKIDLKSTRVVKRGVPVGRKPEPRSHPRCGCSSSEACACCSRCVELHCICGLAVRQRRALCQESRACSCILFDPTARCKLCHGCRQPQGFSHCRCVLHQKLLWTKRHPELEVELTEEEEKVACNCFVLANRHGGAAVTKEKEEKALEEIERVRRIKRASGFSSSENIYRTKKISTFLGDEGLEDEWDDGVDDGPGTEILPPRTESVVPRTMVRRMLHPVYHPASYHPLHRSDGDTLLETIEPRSGAISRKELSAYSSCSMLLEFMRGLENFTYEVDRNATMPSDDLVDFFVYMASIKASNVGELIGTFEDSAAVAGSIVIEEYMAQLIEDIAVKQQAVCPPTEESVQAFTRELLVGFNWQLFQAYIPLDTLEKVETLPEKITAMIFDAFVSTQPQGFDAEAHRDDLEKWIRSAIVIPFFTSTGAIRQGPIPESAWTTSKQDAEAAQPPSKKRKGKPRGRPRKKKSDIVEAPPASPSIRLSVKANPVHGNPSYKLQYATTLADGQCIKASVGGLDSKVKANATLSQLAKTLEHHDKRSKGLLTRPHPPPPVPGPPPASRPLPPLDPKHPYDDMYPYTHEHFNQYRQQKWKASFAEYLSWKVAAAQGLEWVPEHKRKRSRKSAELPQEGSSNKRGRAC